MKRENISEVIENIDSKYVEEATEYKGKKASYRMTWYKWGVAAACLVLLVLGGIKIILPGLLTSQFKYKHQIMGAESAIEWPWEYKTMAEKYHTLRYDSREYGIKNMNPVSEAVLAERLGTGEAEGVDSYTETKYTEAFEVYKISGVSEQKLVAAGRNGEYYVYRINGVEKPATFGELMQIYGLQENLEFSSYQICEGYKGKGYYDLFNDDYIWQILSGCETALLDDSVDSFDRSNRNYLSFTATSDALGVYKRVVYISEDGCFATNVFDYSHIYFIGTDAAGKIIEYAKNNAIKGEAEAYELTVAGEVVEIGDGYVLLDDSVLCRRKADGTVYKIATNDFRMQRCIEFAGIKTGDLVVVNYKGEISPSNEVNGAYSMSRGTLVDGALAIPE